MHSQSVYTERFEDSFAAYVTQEEFGVYGDGIHDDTEGIQKAINQVKDTHGFGIVFIPEGRYLITDTLYVPRAIRLIGYGKTRPTIVLGDKTPGYSSSYSEDKGNAKYMVWFTHKVPEKDEIAQEFDANPGTFYSALTNIDLKIGEGNPSAIALRTHYAQHSFISHCQIEVGSGKAGIFDVGNEMENVHIYGGQYGIITTKCSPGWPFLMVDTSFTGQTKAAIKTREAGFTIVRTHVRDTPVFLTVEDDYWEKLYVEDSILENIYETALEISCENNSFSQYNLRNVTCAETPVLARFKQSGKVIEVEASSYIVKALVHGLQIDDLGTSEQLKTTVEMEPITRESIQPVPSNIPELPSMETWVNLMDLGAKGDGVHDDTEILKKAIEEYETIYLPQGWYIVNETITLKKHTNLIGMSPIGTQLILPDNTESFAGIGGPKPLLEAPVGGTNIVVGIGIDTGGRNARAVGFKWMAGEFSYMNDVKFMGGHGVMEWGNGGFINPYNFNRTGDLYPERKWDSQYWSLWITDGGGGVFKDIWSASPYANAGLYISNTETKGHIYAMSLEHHVRVEARFNKVSNWKIYCLQTEEELAEGPKALPLELKDCSNILFANLYMFRVVMVNTPFKYCIRTSKCSEIEFLNVHNYSQMRYTIDNLLLDVDTNTEVRPWELSRLYLSGESGSRTAEEEAHGKVERLFGDFEFASGGCSDHLGNFYFVDKELKRIYKIDGQDESLTLLMDAPYKPIALTCDTEGRVIVVAEYDTPIGVTENGIPIKHKRPEDATGSSFNTYYPANIKIGAYSFDPHEPESTFTVLKTVKRNTVKEPKKVIYPGNRWHDFKDYETAVMKIQEECFIGLDGATIIPVQYDLIRAAYLSEAIPGKVYYAVDEYYKRTYEFQTNLEGYITSFRLVAEQGEFCSIAGPTYETIYICDGQIYIYNNDGTLKSAIQVPERPASVSFGGKNQNTLFITARGSVYKMDL